MKHLLFNPLIMTLISLVVGYIAFFIVFPAFLSILPYIFPLLLCVLIYLAKSS